MPIYSVFSAPMHLYVPQTVFLKYMDKNFEKLSSWWQNWHEKSNTGKKDLEKMGKKKKDYYIYPKSKLLGEEGKW